MEIQDRDPILMPAVLPDRSVHDRRREKTEIAASSRGKVESTDSQRRRWQLRQRSASTYRTERACRRVRHTIAIVTHWKDRRIVAHSFFGQDVDRPGGLAGDAERRCAIADHRHASRLLEDALG